jgi:hypothetical protein
MPNRIIHERACKSPTLDLLSDGAERLFWRLTTQADDQGRFDAEPSLLLACCFPLRVTRMKLDRVTAWLTELAAAGLVDVYEVGDRSYGAFRTWATWQRGRDSKPKRPDLSEPHAKLISPQLAANGREPPLARACIESRDSYSRGVIREASTTCPRAEDAPRESGLVDGHSTSEPGRWQAAPWPSVEALAHLYNTLTPDHVPAVMTLSPKRRERARRWLREYPQRQWWVETLTEYKYSKFLSGRTPPRPGHENFRPDFDWLLSNGKNGTENAVKVHDGVYRE